MEDDGPHYDFRSTVKAGLHTIGVSFRRESVKLELETAPRERGDLDANSPRPKVAVPPAQMDLRLDGALLKRFEVPVHAIRVIGGDSSLPQARSVVIGGPYDPTALGDTPSRARIFVCRPASRPEEAACAHTILRTLARRAFRRPVTGTDLKPLLAIYAAGRKEGDFDHGIQKAIEALLVSPEFIFRIECDPPGARAGGVYPLSQFELASRLSFFLWSSIPDDPLLDGSTWPSMAS